MSLSHFCGMTIGLRQLSEPFMPHVPSFSPTGPPLQDTPAWLQRQQASAQHFFLSVPYDGGIGIHLHTAYFVEKKGEGKAWDSEFCKTYSSPLGIT